MLWGGRRFGFGFAGFGLVFGSEGVLDSLGLVDDLMKIRLFQEPI